MQSTSHEMPYSHPLCYSRVIAHGLSQTALGECYCRCIVVVGKLSITFRRPHLPATTFTTKTYDAFHSEKYMRYSSSMGIAYTNEYTPWSLPAGQLTFISYLPSTLSWHQPTPTRAIAHFHHASHESTPRRQTVIAIHCTMAMVCRSIMVHLPCACLP